jgi:hypothetical protein
MPHAVRRALVVLSLLAIAAVAAPAALAQAPATLTGEELIDRPAQNTQFQIVCKPVGEDSTGSFTSSGPALGPSYPGTYTEHGTFTAETRPRAEPLGPNISAFDATFTITSGSTTITGTKHLRIEPFSIGDCDEGFDPGPQDDGAEIIIRADYDARISTPDGTFADRGVTEVVTQDRRVSDVSQDRTQDFLETFASVLPAPEPASDRPGKGCGDKNHVHGREGECKKPPR